MRKVQRTGRLALLLLLAFLAIPVLSFAQSTRGALAGNVTDTTGAAVAGAKIVAVAVDTGVRNEAVSTSTGTFHFPELAIGRYNVTISATGFNGSTSKGVEVTINSTTALNVALKPGSVSETVTVDASSPSIESESSDISGTITAQQIQDLPLSMNSGVGGLRSPEAFAFLVPGTTGPGTGGGQGTGGLNNNGVFFMKLSGGQSYGAEVMLDGASITRSENGSSYDETSPSIEAMQEFKVTLAVPSAEFGRTTAGFESFAIKSGTNSYHGTGFSIIKNAAFDADDFINKANWAYYSCTGTRLTTTSGCSGYLRPQDSKFDFGGTLGGPIRIPNPLHRDKTLYNGKDKSFFFFAWEQYKLHQGNSTVSTVPTTAETTGDFSAVLGAVVVPNVINPCDGSAVRQNQIYDPSTTSSAISATNPSGIPCRKPFANNQVPLRSAVAKAMIKGLPAPNQTATANGVYGFENNYAAAFVTPTVNTTYTVRIDQELGQNDKIFGSYSSRDNFRELGVPNLPVPFNNSGYPQDFETHYTRVGWDRTLSPTLMNHLNLGYNRTNSKNFSNNIGSNSLTTDGAPNFYGNAAPTVGWDGLDAFSSWGVGNNGDNIDNGARVNDSVNWIKGRHSFKIGVDWRHQQYSVIQETIPAVNFLRSETDYAATSNIPQLYSGNSFASFELGAVDNSNQTVYNDNPRWNSWYMAGFVQDDIKVNANLTLNLGLRYDVDVPRKEALNRTANFSLTAPDSAAGGLPGALVFGTTCGTCNTAWADTWKKDFAPRVGFSYLLPHTNGKAVLRGGAAIIYGPLQYEDFGGSMAAGFTQNRGVGSSYIGPGTAAGFTPAFELDTGYAAWTPSDFATNTSPTQDQDVGNVYDPWAVGTGVIQPKDGRPSQTTQWSLQVQDQLAQDLILTVGYSALSAQNLRSNFISNVNNIDPKYFSMGDHVNNQNEWIPLGGSSLGVSAPWSGFAGGVGQALRPFPQYDYIANDCCLENMGHSSYESLIVSLNRHFRQGFNLQASYTWSKNETNADSSIGVYAGRDQTQRSDQVGEKAVSVQNVPQQLSISYLYQLPFGKGRMFLSKNAILDAVIGGWEFGGIQRYQTGAPIQFGCATGAPYYQNCFRDTLGAGMNGNIANIANPAYLKNKNGANFFNQISWFNQTFRPAGFDGAGDPGVSLANASLVDQNRMGTGWLRHPSTGCYGGCSFDPYYFSGGSPLIAGGKAIPRVTGAITGPRWLSEDLSILKTFPIHEQVKFQFKAELTNAFNRHHMALPNTNVSAESSYNPVSGIHQNAFGITTGDDMLPRNIQFSGRINF